MRVWSGQRGDQRTGSGCSCRTPRNSLPCWKETHCCQQACSSQPASTSPSTHLPSHWHVSTSWPGWENTLSTSCSCLPPIALESPSLFSRSCNRRSPKMPRKSSWASTQSLWCSCPQELGTCMCHTREKRSWNQQTQCHSLCSNHSEAHCWSWVWMQERWIQLSKSTVSAFYDQIISYFCLAAVVSLGVGVLQRI